MEGQELGKRRDRTADAGAQELESPARRRVSDRIERLLMQLVILGLVLVVLVQSLAVSPALRRKLNLLEGAEGYALTENSSWWSVLTGGTSETASAPAPAKKYTVTVQLQTRRTAPKATLLVDGKAVSDFRTGQATVLVEPGEVIAVDGREYAEPLTFRVVVAQGLSSPPLGEEFSTRAGTKTLGVVALQGR
ncbi:MAG TPA: hypothetical protein VNT75_06010 [Symbiobacteriaceae bacterium]|nr:hypothetical protein [Symbiobacteriaceae bacterium]